MKTLTNNFRLFWQGAMLSYVALFHWLRPYQYVASKLLMPLAQMFFFVYLGTFATGADNRSFYVVGNALQIAAVSGIYGMTMSIGGDRDNGTLGYIFGTPANRLVVFMGRAFMNIMDGSLNVVIAFVWGVTLMGLDLSNTSIPALALVIFITTISTCGLGLLMGCLALITVNVMFVNNFVYFLLLIFSGANIPLLELPVWIRSVSYMLPLTRGIMAAREIVSGASLMEVSPLLLGELGVGIAYFLVGYVLFAVFEVVAKRRGTLEVF
ncbi:MAG TPA: ABC transporter permease [Anaerolineales bacterium]|nr:ABC transporter permease [Anaerolineales bacterium]